MSIFTPRPTGLRLIAGAGPEAVPRTEPRDPTVGLWDHASWMWDQVCHLLADEPGPLAERGWMPRREYVVVLDWVHHLELLVRRLILVLALSFDPGALKPARPRARRERRYRLIWPHRPHEWPARLCIFLRRSRPVRRKRRADSLPRLYAETWPAALRLETLRRILADPTKRARRFALRLARIRARNLTANEKREFAIRSWRPAGEGATSAMWVVDREMRILESIAENALDRWQGPD